ncbi:MAG TPA: sigma 54-interacting transcriptional regulator [Polyangiaceae bacterium]|nr:sigma 54-interacting transcriptional regulator [Polyangiaceae bacterium]
MHSVLESTLTGAPSSRSAAARALQLVVVEPTGMWILPLPESGSIRIGRAEECEARLADARVSRFHATLQVSPLMLEDMTSSNGTSTAGARLLPGQCVELQPGQAFSVGDTVLIVQKVSSRGDRAPKRSTSAEFNSSGGIIIRDPGMKQIFTRVMRLAQGTINVLIQGETGVGKEVVADAIHRASPRASAPFLRIQCAALSDDVLNRQLFGYDGGGADAADSGPGLLELARGGDVLLDEIGELSPTLQARLLHVIETGEVSRVGTLESRPLDVRFLFSSHRNIENLVAEGAFRADLFFRLKGATLDLPPLRKRPSEVIPLAEAFVARAAERMHLEEQVVLTDGARERLLLHDWPGNVRELRNAVERALLLCSNSSIQAEDLALDAEDNPPPSPPEAGAVRATEPPARTSQSDLAGDLERERISQVLLACGGNQSRAAEALGMPRRTLVRKIAVLGLPRPRTPG